MPNLAPSYPIIHYFAMLGRRTTPNPIAVLPPWCMRHGLLQTLTGLPHNMYHFLDGCNYLQRVLLSGKQSGLQVEFVFNDSIEDSSFQKGLSQGLNVFLICTNNKEELIEMNIGLSRVCSKNCLFWGDESVKEIFVMPKVITTKKEYWECLYDYAQPLINQVDAPLAVPLSAGRVVFPYFKPANITYYTLNAALGNWQIGDADDEKKEVETVSEESRKAMSDKHGYVRQEKAVNILGQLFSLCEGVYKSASFQELGFSDQNYPPLILAAPYTNKDVRDFVKLVARGEEDMRFADKVVELEETTNYCYDVAVEEEGVDPRKIRDFILLFHESRIDFHDIVGGLHCSFKFSPYLRLPIICKSINKELSYVSAKNNVQLAYSKDRMAYDNAIHQVGELLAAKLIAPKTAKMLESLPMQIVSITDLPIEWMEVDGVPLAFSHDVCRIPETPASGMLAHFGIARFAPEYKISKDILSKTLIVYGCREDAFKEWQDKADVVANRLGAKTSVCNNIDEFEAAVKSFKPDLLIIDTHGGTDLKSHQSFIYMGNEKVYPKDIAARGIYANMVFISACNTAPCYNDVNTVANALLEAGSAAVTSSYLPLDVKESSTLFIRILNQLNIASQKDIHRNWLAFISHILRTSFIMTPMIETANEEESKRVDPMSVAKVNTLLMAFENRAIVFRKLKNGEEVEGLKYDFRSVVPHFLMYTTIGRADLIQFESWEEKRREEYQRGGVC